MPKLKRAVLIAVEGIDGSGKSTLATNLLHELQTVGYPVILTKQPGATTLGKELRTIVQESSHSIDHTAEFLLYAADRAQHWHELIEPELKNQKLIICDRMTDSSLVYQGWGRGLDRNWIDNINQWIMKGKKADLTIYVKVSVETAFARMAVRNEKPTRFEKEKKQFFDQLVSGFDSLYTNQSNVLTLDGHQSIAELTNQTNKEITQWMNANNLLEAT